MGGLMWVGMFLLILILFTLCSVLLIPETDYDKKLDDEDQMKYLREYMQKKGKRVDEYEG